MFVATYLNGSHFEGQFSLEHAERDIKYFPVCYGSQIGHPVLVMEEFPRKIAHRLWPGVVYYALCIFLVGTEELISWRTR
jgi:hypothetical protein